MSTGWLGNLDGLNLAAAGVETDGRYVCQRPTGRTSAPHIYAAGDIDGRMMLVQSASHEARIAVENALLARAGPQRIPDRAARRLHPPRIRQRRARPRSRLARSGDVVVAVVPVR